MDLIRQFDPPQKRPGQPDFVQLRRVPIQPPETPLDRVWLGAELGYVLFSGDKPRPSDVVTVIGTSPNQIATCVGSPPQRDPLFAGACKCKCPANVGVAFLASAVQRATPIMAYDQDGNLLQVFGGVNAYYPRGIAVDNTSPYDLYLLDDRRTLSTVSNSFRTEFTRDYFWVVRFSISGGQYVYASQTALTDPNPRLTSETLPSLYRPWEEDDPPEFVRNGLSVVGGTLFLTMYKSPARVLEYTGSSFVTRNITLNGVNYTKALRGQIVTVPDRPARSVQRYVCAVTANVSGGAVTISNPELLALNSDWEIQNRINLNGVLSYPNQLASVCNRLFVLDSNEPVPTPFEELLG